MAEGSPAYELVAATRQEHRAARCTSPESLGSPSPPCHARLVPRRPHVRRRRRSARRARGAVRIRYAQTAQTGGLRAADSRADPQGCRAHRPAFGRGVSDAVRRIAADVIRSGRWRSRKGWPEEVASEFAQAWWGGNDRVRRFCGRRERLRGWQLAGCEVARSPKSGARLRVGEGFGVLFSLRRSKRSIATGSTTMRTARCRARRGRHGTRTAGPPCICASAPLSSSCSSWVRRASPSFSDQAPRDPHRWHPSLLWNVPPRRPASSPSKLSFRPITPRYHRRPRNLRSHPTSRPRHSLGPRRAAGRSPRTAALCGSPRTECPGLRELRGEPSSP